RAAARRRAVLLCAENEPQDVRLIRPIAVNGHGMNAIWNDDFHHTAVVRLTRHNEAYYSDFTGTSSELITAVKSAFLYQGQYSNWQRQPRGTPTRGLSAERFIHFLQNHDQIANSATGTRIDRLTSPGRLRAMTALWLLSPQTPLFFQGQEFGASSPFLFFADHTGEMARQVAAGRAKFLSQFPSVALPEVQQSLADPSRLETFERCRPDFSERRTHAESYRLHQDLLRLRRDDPVFRRQRSDLLDAAVLGPDGLVVRYFGGAGDDRLLIVNFGVDLKLSPAPEPLLAPPCDRSWRLLWTSNSLEYGGPGPLLPVSDKNWLIPGECASVLIAVPERDHSESPASQQLNNAVRHPDQAET
ncbi:MAG: DUF3459 domain-containing protein, partial [Planctomycetia bacterium]|nr:DUF3459 domain-containing protein [Planctomycetia bacterium]